MTRSISLTIALLATIAGGAHAQDRIRQTVVVTATAAPVSFDNLARSVAVLTREQIARLPARSVAEVLRFAAGVDVRTRGAFGMQTDFAVRGATFGQTLVLVDGVRINNAQSGHHNGDIPVPIEDIDRIEILYGAGSSIHGADAFGGTINVITRRGAAGRSASLSAGDFGLIQGAARWSGGGEGAARSVAVEAARSSGFTFARDFGTVNVNARTRPDRHTRVQLGHVRKAFGASGFYGPSPSREWTNQTLATVERSLLEGGPWSAAASVSYRTHGDRFLWDVRRPGELENRHRTHATAGSLTVRRALDERTRLTFGGDAGGDWIDSTNLGRHRFARGGAFAELQYALGERAVVYPSLRYDTYSAFGDSWNPSLSASLWLAPPVRWRGAVGRAFRIPTFTELYYRDPAHEAGGALTPEMAWSAETGLDWVVDGFWLASATIFSRHERDVIDWIRESPLERWRSTNIRRVATRGVELELRRFVGPSGFAGLQYAWLSAEADVLPVFSKYVLEYARHSLAGLASTALPAQLELGQRLSFTRRADGRHYWVADLRLARRVRHATLFVEGTNLFDRRYQEIPGVDMPGRWIRVGLQLGGG
jgi:outer membrane cobalamin receptor